MCGENENFEWYINELKREVKSLRQDVSKGKGAVAVLVFIGTLVASIVGFLNFK